MKAVVFDLDDTLLHDDRSISDFSVNVFRRLSEKGYRIIAASGRSQYSMQPYISRLGCVSAYISCNGAEIWDASDGRLIHKEYFSAGTAVEIARFAEDHHCYAHVYDGKYFYFNQYGPYADRYASASQLTGVYAGRLSDYIHEPRNKILMIDSEYRIAQMYAKARKQFSHLASVTCSKPIFLEFNPLRATKGIALKTVADYLGFRTDETVAFGDSLNDLSMLQIAGQAVVVSNGWPEVISSFGQTCESNNHDGPASFMNIHYLNGEVMH